MSHKSKSCYWDTYCIILLSQYHVGMSLIVRVLKTGILFSKINHLSFLCTVNMVILNHKFLVDHHYEYNKFLCTICHPPSTMHVCLLLQAYPIWASIRVVYGCGLWTCYCPLVPHSLPISQSPHEQLYCASCSNILWLLASKKHNHQTCQANRVHVIYNLQWKVDWEPAYHAIGMCLRDNT